MSYLKNLFRGIALEELVPGEAYVERELEFIAKLSDFTQLEKAARAEHHEQWQRWLSKDSEKGEPESRLRVRATRPLGGDSEGTPTLDLTQKTKWPLRASQEDSEGGTPVVVKGEVETTCPVDSIFFENFKAACSEGMIKTRYYFPDEESGLTWEIDVFSKADGSPFEYVKIDLELREGDTRIPPYPIQFDEVFVDDVSVMTDDQRELSEWLYKNEFVSKKDPLKP